MDLELTTLNYGREIARLRKSIKMTQKTLSESLGISIQQVSNIERGGSCSRTMFLEALNVFGYGLQEKIYKK